MTFIGNLRTLDKYSNSTYHGVAIGSMGIQKTATYDEDGHIEEDISIVIYSIDGMKLGIHYPKYAVDDCQGADYWLCAIQDDRGIDVQK